MHARLIPAALLLALSACRASNAAEQPSPRLWRSEDEIERCLTIIAKVFEEQPSPQGGLLSLHLNAHIGDSLRSVPPREANVLVAIEQVFVDDTVSVFDRLELVGDDSLRAAYAGRAGKPRESTRIAGATVEHGQFRIPLTDLTRLARARKVTGAIAQNTFHLTPEQMGVLRELTDYLRGWPRVPALPEGDFVGLDCLSHQGPENAAQLGG